MLELSHVNMQFEGVIALSELIYGLLLVVIMVFRPEGLLGSHEVWELFRWRRKNNA